MIDDGKLSIILLVLTLIIGAIAGIAIYDHFNPKTSPEAQSAPITGYVLTGGTALMPISPMILPKTQILGSITGYTKLETCAVGDCITASGQEAHEELVACPYWIPLGTLIEIKDIGFFRCEDRTAVWVQEKHENTFDIWFGDDYSGAIKFGRQYKEVIIY
jgi:3D (Asp-Asp-Asp) domain-containing protein